MPDASRRSFLAAAGGFAMTSLVSSASAQAKIKPGADTALIVVDVQNCFTPGRALAVKKGDEIVPLINSIAAAFENVVMTQDWHTPGTSRSPPRTPARSRSRLIKLAYGTQVLWPDHCVQGTDGAAIHKDLNIPHAQLVIRKGYNQQVDSYSAFYEADGKTKTGLAGYLQARGIKTRVRRGPRHRLLRRLDGAGRAQARPRAPSWSRTPAAASTPRLARRGVEEHGEAAGVKRHPVGRAGDPGVACFPGLASAREPGPRATHCGCGTWPWSRIFAGANSGMTATARADRSAIVAISALSPPARLP